MLRSTEQLIGSPLRAHVFTETDLEHFFDGSDARRYGLVNKALKKKEWIRLRRGLYLLAPQYQTQKPSLYYLANQIAPHSYVSLETALSYHGWIPEKVETILSMTATGRARVFHTPFGEFNYFTSSAIYPYEFYTGVTRELLNQQAVLIASPLRALCDYVVIHKIQDANIDFLVQNLRIEPGHIKSLRLKFIDDMKKIYASKYAASFLEQLEQEIKK